MQDFDGKCYEKTPEVIRVSRSVVLYNGEGIALFIICGETVSRYLLSQYLLTASNTPFARYQ